MTRESQDFALDTFVDDVLEPAAQRWREAKQGGPQWRSSWAAAEVIEAAQLLRLGSTLGVLPPLAVDDPLEVSRITASIVGPDLPFLASAERAMLGQTLGLLRGLPSPDEDLPPAKRRALSRARGLFRANVLCASELGHGVAAEALAPLVFGGAEGLVESVHAELQHEQVSARTRRQMLTWMASPGSEPRQAWRMRGSTLAVSMFHATEFLYSVGYSHALREKPAMDSGSQPAIDPLKEQIGISTGDILHRVLYWRMPFDSPDFKRGFLNLLRPCSELLFRCGLPDHEGGNLESAGEYAIENAVRVGRAADTWATAFHLSFEDAGYAGGALGKAGEGRLGDLGMAG